MLELKYFFYVNLSCYNNPLINSGHDTTLRYPFDNNFHLQDKRCFQY